MQPIDAGQQVDEILFALEDGVERAFGYAKIWSKHCKDAISFVQRRIDFGLFEC